MATWQIETLRYTNNSDKVVTQAHWRCFDSEESDGKLYTADNYGAADLDEIKPDASGFIAYGDLTESRCLEWVHAKVNKADIEKEVKAAVDAQITPAHKTGKPWS